MVHFHSNGKLLLTGEYVVLDGCKSLALPTKRFGQSLEIFETSGNKIEWKSYTLDNELWFSCVLEIGEELRSISEETKMIQTLIEILEAARKLNPKFLSSTTGFEIKTKLDFPREWGLGTSSTVVSNIAKWAKVDPFVLLFTSFKGSGYDIACAYHYQPLLYTIKKKPKVELVSFNPPFKEELFFVYPNQKQDSKE